jgi:hypothetical protein
MLFLASNLGPLVTEEMLAVGPWLVPAILAALAALAVLAGWLLLTGIRRRSAGHIALGAPLALYLVAVAAAFFAIV